MKKMTIKDISEMAGVSRTTVSFVLNNRSGISEITRQKVFDVVAKAEYVPNLNSRRLILKRSFNICVAINSKASPIVNRFYMRSLLGVLEESKHHEFSIVFNDISGSNARKNFTNMLNSGNADGIIFFQDIHEDILKHVVKEKIASVIIDPQDNYNGILTVSCNYAQATNHALEYIISNGHRDIGIICMDSLPTYYLSTITAYNETLAKHGIIVNPKWVSSKAEDEQTAYTCMANILKSKKRPTAIFCAQDIFAIGAIQCLKDNNIKIPGDMSIIAIDDIDISQYITPSLTTMRIDAFEMGRIAMRLIVNKISGHKVKSASIRWDDLIVRHSVKQI